MSDSLTLSLANRTVEVERMTAAVDQFARAHGMAADDLHNIHLMLDELVINIIRHGYDDDRAHIIDLRLSIEASVLTIALEDDGLAFDPTKAPLPKFHLPIEERPIGGLGVHIVKTLCDTMTYRRVGDRNVLTVTKTVHRA